MSWDSLEKHYIEFLDDSNYRGYSEHLRHDNEKEFYRRMHQFLNGGNEK